MNMGKLSKLLGNQISSIAQVKYLNLGIESISVCSSGIFLEIRAREVLVEWGEAYDLDVEESLAMPIGSDVELIDIGQVVNKIEILKRDEWLETAGDIEGIIGANARYQEWGKVGGAPNGVNDAVTVSCAIVFYLEGIIDGFMVFVSDYPELIGVSWDAAEIIKFRSQCTVQEIL